MAAIEKMESGFSVKFKTDQSEVFETLHERSILS